MQTILGEHGDRRHGDSHIRDPDQDAEQEADERERRQDVGQHRARDDEQA